MQLGKIKTESAIYGNEEYTCQVYPLDGKVYSEIVRVKRDHGYDGSFDGDILFYAIMHKSFGRSSRSAPREKDYLNAKNWVMEQFDLLQKHSTCVITKPKYFIDREWSRMKVKYGWDKM